ncbi:MAG TPA: menaquinone biosynthesis protein [Terriglobales bacterium]
MERLRVSAISYLNTAPLMWGFEHENLGADLEISYTLPSSCAAQLKAGTADIGIIPVAAYATIPDLVILPGVAIASRRAVRSILLVSKVPREQIHTVALDTSSMTSVALTKVLFAKWWGGNPQFVSMPPHLDAMLREHDAALVIGDPALKIDRSRYVTYDLAEEWNKLTGKSFVFAFWAVRQAALKTHSAQDLPTLFQTSRDHGLRPESLAAIAREWSPRLDLSEPLITEYLTQSIHYDLDPACLEGLRLFLQYANECGALPANPSLSFLDLPRVATVCP